MEFNDAANLLRTIVDRLDDESRVFLSASELHIELGDGYPHVDLPLEDRFAQLATEMRGKHDIRDQICLYTVKDMRTLFATAGLRPVRIDRSGFGNVKAIGEPGWGQTRRLGAADPVTDTIVRLKVCGDLP